MNENKITRTGTATLNSENARKLAGAVSANFCVGPLSELYDTIIGKPPEGYTPWRVKEVESRNCAFNRELCDVKVVAESYPIIEEPFSHPAFAASLTARQSRALEAYYIYRTVFIGLSFADLRKANKDRKIHPESDAWNGSGWSNALAGEVGEVCNVIKKIERGDYLAKGCDRSAVKDLADELADVICYADKLADMLGIDLGESVRAKFNEVSEKYGSDVKL